MGPLTQPCIWAASKELEGGPPEDGLRRARSVKVTKYHYVCQEGSGQKHCGVLCQQRLGLLSRVSSAKLGELTQVTKCLWVSAASSA